MGFTFSLQALLNWKRDLEEMAQMRLAEKTKKLMLVEEHLERLRQERSFFEETLAQRSSRGIAASEFLLHREFLEHRTEALWAGQRRRKEIAQEVEMERQNLLRLMKEKKALELLKEKKEKAFEKEMEKKESKEQNDLSVMRYRFAKSKERSS